MSMTAAVESTITIQTDFVKELLIDTSSIKHSPGSKVSFFARVEGCFCSSYLSHNNRMDIPWIQPMI